jgi:hypothetical protein
MSRTFPGGVWQLSHCQLSNYLSSKRNLSKIIDAIHNAVPGSFEAVDCGTFSRKKPSGQ